MKVLNPRVSAALPVLGLIAAGIALRLAWIAYTNFTDEDAFITFRFAQQIASGKGFVYNPGERIYGTTTPLFTLLMAAWLRLLTADVVTGARILNILAAVGASAFVARALHRSSASRSQQLIVVALLAISSKFWQMDTAGMETPLVIFFMVASWYAYIRKRNLWTGVLCGLLLWTRIDLILWPLTIVFFELLSKPRSGVAVAFVTAITYAPWAIFATLYFGSPIPHTIIAKWVAYIEYGSHIEQVFFETPLSELRVQLSPLAVILHWLSPFEFPERFRAAGTALLWSTLIVVSWQSVKVFKRRRLALLPVFALLEIARLTITKATVFHRYFVPPLWVVLLLLGMGIGALWDRLSESPGGWFLVAAVIVAFAVVGLLSGALRAADFRQTQRIRHVGSLKAMGSWLKENSNSSATVQLEPLGYVGYYSGRWIYDEVGIVTPRVVALKRRGLREQGDYVEDLKPDFVVVHCDDAMRELQSNSNPELSQLFGEYERVAEFDPLDFKREQASRASDADGLARSSCYEIWKR